MEQRGPKLGWTLGGLGGLIWMALLAVIFLADGMVKAGLLGAGFFLAGCIYLIVFAPWRHPETPLWRIYLGLIGILILAALVLLYSWIQHTGENVAFSWFFLPGLLPLLFPVFTFGRKTWQDLHRPE